METQPQGFFRYRGHYRATIAVARDQGVAARAGRLRTISAPSAA